MPMPAALGLQGTDDLGCTAKSTSPGCIRRAYDQSAQSPAPAPVCCTTTATSIRTSVGVGLIWASPFGPLRFDYAVPITKGQYDRVQQFKFGGGTSF